MRVAAGLGLLACTALVVAMLASPMTSSASAPAEYKVTLAARWCPSYSDITANKARNNIMESLRDLGPDTPYAADQLVSAGVEEAHQPKCHPIVGWHFTFGDQIAGQVTGPWGALSVVRNPEAEIPVTRASVPLLDDAGDPTGQMLDGAVNVTLTPAQLQLAERQQLWVQGGLVHDPVEDVEHPGLYGFGALRCAMDNLNGDNVEWIGFPQSVHHVFCFAYYVKPPPTSGTIIVRKEVPSGNTDTQTFDFGGDVSFNPGGSFSLEVNNGRPAETTFVRAAGATPWNVVEDVPVNWTLQSLQCTSSSTSSPSTFVYSGPHVAITLAAGDTVTCTYVDAPVAATQLLLRKVSYGGVGTFHYTITDGSSTTHAVATTTEPGVAVDATPTGITSPGTYTITESSPVSVASHWELRGVECDGTDYTPTKDAITLTIAAGATPTCTFTNDLVLDGSITIYKVMHGGLGTAGFQVSSAAFPEELWLEATPTRQGEATRAEGASTEHLSLGTYVIQEFAPGGSDPAGWTLSKVTCAGAEWSVRDGVVTVTLTASAHHATCTFTDQHTPATVPTTIPKETTSPVTPTTIRVTG